MMLINDRVVLADMPFLLLLCPRPTPVPQPAQTNQIVNDVNSMTMQNV